MKKYIKNELFIMFLCGISLIFTSHAAQEASQNAPAMPIQEETSSHAQTVDLAAYSAASPVMVRHLDEKEPQATAAEEEKETSAKYYQTAQKQQTTQLLTIFLDNSEAQPYKISEAVTSTLLHAIKSEAGPIITSPSLIYNFIQGPYAQKNPEIALAFNQLFNNGAHWIIKEIVEHLVIMIPKSYELLKEGPPYTSLGLHIERAAPVTVAELVERYAAFSLDKWIELDDNTGRIFMKALTDNLIFDRTNTNTEWIIYLMGHGLYEHYLANITLDDFKIILDFLAKNINIALFVYDSCYAAGLNAQKIYGELTQAGSTKEYSFPIITKAITDSPTRSSLISYKDGEILFKLDFASFLQQFLTDRQSDSRSYEKALVYIMPDITQYRRNMPIDDIRESNLPLIRPPHSPAWFPVSDDKKSIIRITKTMALTRNRPLFIGTPQREKTTYAVLLDTIFIPFDIVIMEGATPQFIVTTPGDTIIKIKKVIQKNHLTISDFLQSIGLNFAIKPSNSYIGNKQIHIEELILEKNRAGDSPTSHQNKNISDEDIKDVAQDPTTLYTNVIIDLTSQTMYYTDMHNKQFIIANKKTKPFYGDYLAFRSLQKPYQSIMEQQYNRSEFKKLEKTVENKIKNRQDIRDIKEIKKHNKASLKNLEIKEQKLREKNIQKIEKDLATRRFQQSIINNDLPKAVTYLAQGANIHASNEDNLPILMYAVSAEAIQFLLNNGADVNARDNNGNTPLLNAIKDNKGYDIVQKLLAHGANVATKNDNNETVFSFDCDQQTADLLKNALKKEIHHIIDSVRDYELLLEPTIHTLRLLSNQEKITDNSIAEIATIKNYFNTFLKIPDATKWSLLDMIMHAQALKNQANYIPGFPEEQKNRINETFATLQQLLYNSLDSLLDPHSATHNYLKILHEGVIFHFEQGEETLATQQQSLSAADTTP